MCTSATRSGEYTTEPILFMAFELSENQWVLGFSTGLGQAPRRRTMPARDTSRVMEEIRHAKRRFHLAETCPVMSIYEAGREGFWLHRFLSAQGIENQVVDSSSIEVNRRKRRTKTDRMDVEKLLKLIVRQQLGERGSFSVVHVPSWEAEDRRQLHRELETLKKERTSHICRIKALLATQGLRISLRKDFPRHLSELTLWDGRHVPPYLQARLLREYERILQVQEQRAVVRAARRELLRHSMEADVGMVRHLMALKSIGVETAWTMVMELFGWREFDNRRELGGISGLCGSPYDSGESRRDLGVSKAGNRRVRTLCVELAWRWLIHQPDSELTRWFNERYADGGSRVRRVGIVALARKLLVALWRYLETGEIPQGAVLKTVEF